MSSPRLTTFLALPVLLAGPAALHAQVCPERVSIAEQRADPWVHKTPEGMYYLMATVPEYDRIVLRKAETINGLYKT